MNDNINLIHKQVNQDKNGAKNIFYYRVLAIVIVLLTFLSSSALLYLKTQSPLPRLQAQENQLLVNLQSRQNSFIKYSILSDKVDSIAGILSTRLLLNVYIDTIEQQLPSDVGINQIDISSGVITLHTASTSIGSLNDFFNHLIDLINQKKMFSSIIIDSFALQSDGSYVALLRIFL